MNTPHIFIISGPQGKGKTTKLVEVLDLLAGDGYAVNGFIAPGEWESGKRNKFYIQDINTGDKLLLCKNSNDSGFERVGRFYFNMETLEAGNSILKRSDRSDVCAIDEIGRFELMEKVWFDSLKRVIKENKCVLIITVRDEFVEEVITHFKMVDPSVFTLETGADKIADDISNVIKQQQI